MTHVPTYPRTYLFRGDCSCSEASRPFGDRTGRPLAAKERVERPRGLGEGSPAPLLPELKGLAPWVGEVGLSRLATPTEDDPYAACGVLMPACC